MSRPRKWHEAAERKRHVPADESPIDWDAVAERPVEEKEGESREDRNH